jgi:ferric iron reductase protein FhuF
MPQSTSAAPPIPRRHQITLSLTISYLPRAPIALTSDASAFDRFGHLIFDHLDPLIEMWSERSEVTRRVLWSNVGNTFEAMLCRVEAVSGASPRLEEARHLLNHPVWPGGRSN